jgi:hypothetical protein
VSNKLVKRAIASGPVKYEVRGPADQPTGLMLSINYEDAPVPDHYYVADWFDVRERDLDVILSFGNLDRGRKLRSKVEIVFPSFTFVNQLWRSSLLFHGNLRKFLDDLKLPGVTREDAELSSDKLQILVSNNVLMVWSGTECLLDFFYISPKDLWSKPRRGERLDLEPVVRVLVSPSLLDGFLDACDITAAHLSERFPEYIRKGDPENENLESQYVG